GRSIYTSSFSGVYWEVQDLVLDDIDRIEVIRGPGATLWGANAVNGVINIVTRSAHETKDGFFNAIAGSEERESTLRFGGNLGSHTAYRTSVKYADRDEFHTIENDPAGDNWHIGHFGFRLDSSRPSGDLFTVQGDYIDARINQGLNQLSLAEPYQLFVQDQVDSSSWNILGRWRRPLSVNSDISLQVYLDHSRRSEGFVGQHLETGDIEFQHRFAWGERNDVIWGLGYRHIRDDYELTEQVFIDPAKLSHKLLSGFVQDEITVVKDRLNVAVGVKVENNDFTGTEVQPNFRFIWTPGNRHSIWGAVAKASRTPSRAERDARLLTGALLPNTALNPLPFPLLVFAAGNPDFRAEELTAVEAGYRAALSPRLNLDLALFRNDYDGLRTAEANDFHLVDFTYVELPLDFSNGGMAQTRGLELAADWRPLDRFRVQLAFSELNVDFATKPGVEDLENRGLEKASPERQLSLRSGFDFSKSLTFDLWARYVSEVTLSTSLSNEDIPQLDDYWDLDFRLSWKPGANWELSLVGQNLLDSGRLEGFTEPLATNRIQVPRGYYASFSWIF
ncbi:MAG: TonB-dependent receptor, partial [Xanthomonadales bacterium]|nr:TonB-dependent receptor [Xanthomonadales bacterium]